MIKKKERKKEKDSRSKKWSGPAHVHQAAHVPLTLVALACLHLSAALRRRRNSHFRLRPSLCLFPPVTSASAHISLSLYLSLDGGRGTEEAGCCRPALIGGRRPRPAGGRSLLRLHGSMAGGWQLLPSAGATCSFWLPSRSLVWSLPRARSLAHWCGI